MNNCIILCGSFLFREKGHKGSQTLTLQFSCTCTAGSLDLSEMAKMMEKELGCDRAGSLSSFKVQEGEYLLTLPLAR